MSTLNHVSLDIAVVLGTTSMPIHQVLRLGRGAIIELDSTEDDAVKILANDMPVAKGTVVVNGNRIAVEVAELLPRAPDQREFPALCRSRALALVGRGAICYMAPVQAQPGRDGAFSHVFLMRPWRNW